MTQADPRRRSLIGTLALGASALALQACGRRYAGSARNVVVFRHPKLFGDPAPLERVVADFEKQAGVEVRRETLPSSSDEQHLFYAINFQAAAAEFDVLALDVVWGAEFARAGWLRELTHLLADADRADLFPGPLAAATWNDRAFALPWFADAGLLYCRTDLLERAGLPPPRTWPELLAAASAVRRFAPEVYGFVWQGKQYEGLVCNTLEFVRSHGGALPLDAGDATRGAAVEGLAFMRALVDEGVTPAHVTTLTEEPSRVIFGQGRALFLRNWPYAWSLLERAGSVVHGRVAVQPLPHAPGERSAPTLGGWMLGVNAASSRASAAEALVSHLASAPAQRALAAAYGYSPPRRSLYREPALAAAQPFLASLAAVFEEVRPRPVSPHYVALSQELQAAFSGVLTGRLSPRRAMVEIAGAAAALEAR
jgi:multiple sugar transport system substrate-binding protein